jgi:hypothetical protein
MNVKRSTRVTVWGLALGLSVLMLTPDLRADRGRGDHDRNRRPHPAFVGRRPLWARRAAALRLGRALRIRRALIYRTPVRHTYSYVAPPTTTYGYSYTTGYPTCTTYTTPTYGYPTYSSPTYSYPTYSYPAYSYPTYYSSSSGGFHYGGSSFGITIRVNVDD